MSGSLRLLDTGLEDARWNVGITTALLELHAEGRIPDTLRFHRYRRCLLAGASQPVEQVPSVAGLEVVQRASGGGTVAMSPGILAWDLVVRRRRRDLVGTALTQALRRFDVAAEFRPPGDVLVGGCKLAGLAGAYESGSCLHQGALLVEGDPAELAGRFCLPVRPVVTLAVLVRPTPTMAEIVEAVATAFAAAFGLPLRRGELGRLERDRADELFLADVAA